MNAEYHETAKINTRNFTDADVSDVADSLNFILSALEAPKSVRVLLHGLCGLVAGRTDRVEFYHLDLGKRMFTSKFIPADERGKLEENVRRAIAKFQEWSTRWQGLTIEYKPGHRGQDGEHVPSSIELPLIAWAADVANQVRRQVGELDQVDERKRAELYRKAVDDLMRRKKIKQAEDPEKPTKREQGTRAIYKTLMTTARKYVEKHAAETGRAPAELISSLVWDLASKLEAEFENIPPYLGGVEADHVPPHLGGYETTTPDYETVLANIDRADAVSRQSTHVLALDTKDHVACQNVGTTGDGEGSQGGMAVPDPDAAAVLNDIQGLPGDHFKALEACLSVGVQPVEWLWKDDVTRRKVSGAKVTVRQFAEDLCKHIGEAEKAGKSFIGVFSEQAVICRDDLNAAGVERLRPYAFMTVETSPGNFHAWLKVEGGADIEAIRRRFHARLNELHIAGNAGGTVGLRWPGSVNAKPDRNGFRVRLHSTQPGRAVTAAELAEVGLLAEPPCDPSTIDRSNIQRQCDTWKGRHKWPDYDECLRVKPSRSEADARFTYIALRRGFALDDIKAKLEELSDRARQSGPKYINRTVNNVTAWAGEV